MDYCFNLNCWHFANEECEYKLTQMLTIACTNYKKMLFDLQDDWINEIILCGAFIIFLQKNDTKSLMKDMSKEELNLLLASCLVQFEKTSSQDEIDLLNTLISRINKYRC